MCSTNSQEITLSARDWSSIFQNGRLSISTDGNFQNMGLWLDMEKEFENKYTPVGTSSSVKNVKKQDLFPTKGLYPLWDVMRSKNA